MTFATSRRFIVYPEAAQQAANIPLLQLSLTLSCYKADSHSNFCQKIFGGSRKNPSNIPSLESTTATLEVWKNQEKK